MVDKHITFYNKLKRELFTKFLFVSGSKTQIVDLVVYGIDEDQFYKIITPDLINKTDIYINNLSNQFKLSTLKRKYVLVYVDKDYNETERKEIIISE